MANTRDDIRFLLEQIYDLYTGGEGDFSKLDEIAGRYNFKLDECVEDLEENAVISKDKRDINPMCDRGITDGICMRCAAVGTKYCR